jgi:hypothetical protein
MSGAYEVELALSDEGTKLASGFVARVELYPSLCEPMAVIPIEALVEADEDKGYVYVPDEAGSTASKKAVTLGCVLGERIAVRSGLDDIGTVITDGAPYLTDGAAIRLVGDTSGQEQR